MAARDPTPSGQRRWATWRPLASRPWRAVLRDVAIPFLVTRLLLALVTLTAPLWRFAVPDPGRFLSPARPIGGTLLSRWYNWDAAWYLRIAGFGPQMGYSHYYEGTANHFSAFAFFPLYPLIVRVAALMVPGAHDLVPAGGTARPEILITALIASNLIFVLALIALHALMNGRAGPATARRAVWIFCLFPTTIFFSAPYSESLFLLWLVLFFLALDRRNWWLAGLAGALASATRSLGVCLALPYLVCFAQAAVGGRQSAVGSERWRLRPGGTHIGRVREEGDADAGPEGPGQGLNGPARGTWSLPTDYRLLSTRLAPVALIPLGLVAYMLYLQLAWGHALLFEDAEKAWQRSLAAPWVGIVDGLSWSLRGWPHLPQQNWRGLTDALYAIVFLTLNALAWRDIGWVERSYCAVFWLYVLCLPQISDPLYPDTLISMARLLLMLLPLWLWLARSSLRTRLFVIPSVVLFVLYAARWVNHGWIA